MFAPSFFTGNLIKRFGVLNIMFYGAVFGVACIVINLNGASVSWNFLFIGATTLLTETYAENEKFKAQALNDFLVFSVISVTSLFAGISHHKFGWQFINYIAISAIAGILFCLTWLYKTNKHTIAIEATT